MRKTKYNSFHLSYARYGSSVDEGSRAYQTVISLR